MTSLPMPYQYVVLRCVPRADREEFVNVGVVVYCEEAEFLDLAWRMDPSRIHSLDPSLDLDQVSGALEFAHDVCRGRNSRLGNEETALGQRFGMLKAPRSTTIQPGPVHGGVSHNPAAALEFLLARLVR
jgi:Protein of unknown function (DUF3037)